MKWYRLGIPPWQPILSGVMYEEKSQAKTRAREENKIGEFKGRGVKVYQCDESGILIKEV